MYIKRIFHRILYTISVKEKEIELQIYVMRCSRHRSTQNMLLYVNVFFFLYAAVLRVTKARRLSVVHEIKVMF